MQSRELVVVGGPNGSGKTTFARAFRAERNYPYLGADLIAAELNPENPAEAQVAAGREFLHRLDQCLIGSESILVETTLSGRGFRNFLERARAAGFAITILFLFLDSAETSLARVRERVRLGGHDVPEADVRRRFLRSLRNFWHLYRPIADNWFLIYNAGSEFQEVANGSGDCLSTRDEMLFTKFLNMAGESND